jgi:uncharacterized protein HemX
LLTILVPVVVALVGLVGVGLTAYASIRSNALRLAAEEKARRQAEEAERSAAEAAALRSDRDKITAGFERLIEVLTADNERLRAHLREAQK